MSNRARKPAHQERQTAPVLPTASFIRHGYDIEEGPHSPQDVAFLEREGKQDNGLSVRRVRSGVRRLWQDGRITGAEVAASERWASDYGLGVHGASHPMRRGSSCRGDVHSFKVATMNAHTRYREASRALASTASSCSPISFSSGKGWRP